MAGLNHSSVTHTVCESRRGQLLLVGAFGLAVLLLVLAGVLNTVSYTESLAARGGDVHDGRDVTAFQEDTRHAVRSVVRRVNANESMPVDVKQTTVEQSAADWGDAVGRHHAADLTGASVTVLDVRGGDRITQESANAFVSADGAENWTLATDVSEERHLRLRIDRSSLASDRCDNASCFELVANGTADTWRLTVNRTTVAVDGPDSGGTCPIESDPVRINVTAGTVDGEECGPLAFADGLSGYRIEYRNGSNAAGTYRITVRGSAETANLNADAAPSYDPLVYDVAVRVTYRTPDLRYETELRVTGGEPDG